MTVHWSKNSKTATRFRQFHVSIHTYHDDELVEINVSADGVLDNELGYEVLEPDIEFALLQFIDALKGDYSSVVVWNKAVMLDCALGNHDIDDDDIDSEQDVDFYKID